jgi:rhodanese-related sulfurtransferase
MPTNISAVELATLVRSGEMVDLIDVRSAAEFREVHLECARNVPLNILRRQLFQQRDSTHSLYVICQKGSRSKLACERLAAAGVINVVNVEGGTEACIAAGLPIVRGKRMISLERQVRIAAGSLVLVGLLLAWLVHPAFIALSAFVGAGLVFAGITDTCGMGMLLARMPWNQLRANRQASCTTNMTPG